MDALTEPRPRAPLKAPFGVQKTINLDDRGHETGPAGLMSCRNPWDIQF
jgi:hypothetical protein